MRRELERFTIGERELKRKREELIESYERLASDPEGCAHLLYDLEVDGVSIGQYLAEFSRITLARVRATARSCFSSDGAVLVVVRSKP